MDDSFAFVGTDFLLAAAAELERRATLVQQGGGTPVQGGRTPQRSRAGSVADQIEDENYESYGQGPFAQGPSHTGPRPDHAQPPPPGGSGPPRQARRSLPLDLPALEAGTETLVEASLREQLVLQREKIALMEKQLQLQQLLQQQQSANAATSTASPAPCAASPAGTPQAAAAAPVTPIEPLALVAVEAKPPTPAPDTVATPLSTPDKAAAVKNMLKDPTVKVDNYDGSTPIDTHLGKFNITARCCQWTPEKRLYFLTQSLVGKAADITANLPATADEAYVVDKLKQFYRGKHQANRHEAEMKSRQRKKGETILSLFQDISRLKDLAFPGQTNDQIEKICLEAFLEALCDEHIQAAHSRQRGHLIGDGGGHR